MTLVRFRRQVPTPAGAPSPARGSLRFTPTARRVVPGSAEAPASVVLPVAFTVPLVDGAADVNLEANTGLWAWRIDEAIDGLRPATSYVSVPAAGTVDEPTLTTVDPATLEPAAAPDPAWWSALQQAQLGVHATPDPDDPDVLILHFQSWQTDPADGSILLMPIYEETP